MTRTPWGDSDTLRGRMLSPGRGTPRAAVRQNQRERLFGAMVATVAEKGYERARVEDLVELSGVSRRAFHEHFDDKLGCFLATLEEIVVAARAVTAAPLRREGSWEERSRRAMEAFVELLVAQPAAARLCLVEAHAAGPAATRRVDEAVETFEQLLRQAFEEQPDRRGMPPEMTRAMIGGFRKIIHTRLHRGTEAELPELLPDLLDLGLSYRPPPAPLSRKRRRRGGNSATEMAGDARTAKGRRGEDPGERIVRATMGVVAERGYQGTTIAAIAERAAVSPSTFYEHFDDKAAAFDAALYSGRARMLGVVMPAYQRGRGWPESIRAATQASLSFLAAEPEFARLVTVDVYAAGTEALERRDRAIEAMQRTIDDGLQYAQLEPIAREAIISAIYAMLCDRVQQHGVEDLSEIGPLVVYMTLAPFVGAEQAAATAKRLGSA